jgi:hypothetical protein
MTAFLACICFTTETNMKFKLLLSVVCRRRILLCTFLLGTQLIPFNIAHAEDSASVFEEVIVVTGTRATAPASQIKPDSEAFVAPDAAALVQRLPGDVLINNGSLSGQVQYRGMFGSRVSTKIKSQSFHSGGDEYQALRCDCHWANCR